MWRRPVLVLVWGWALLPVGLSATAHAGKVYLFRHGQAESNLKDRFAGQQDWDITPLGVKQGVAVGRWLKHSHAKLDYLWSSQLKRARKTAEAMQSAMWPQQDVPVLIHSLLQERNLGDWEGQDKATIRAQYGDKFPWIHKGFGMPPGQQAERLDHLLSRAHRLLTSEILPQLDVGADVGIVSHTHMLKALYIQLLNTARRVPLEEIMAMKFENGVPIVIDLAKTDRGMVFVHAKTVPLAVK